ncbi:MAG: GAF domain-containing protein [Eubacterium sp.]|nr:GAF domain-containing protein [Eubacterium sp.]MCM1342238.1 GAF domain-containing protein [Muribaculaceae bacterium]MCM1409187.1 GAF domain-containing protein [Lachnospiraceae bacterium]
MERGIYMEQGQAEKILEMGIQLTSERNYDVLLMKIIDCAMETTNCDGGTLYLYEDGQLSFSIMKTKSLGINRGGQETEALPPVPMNEKNVCACAALQRKLLNIEDAYNCQEFDFSGPREYDKMTGYRTQSMLVFPLVSHEGELVGVVQLINAMDEQGKVIPFRTEYEKILESLGSQAAVSVSNMQFVQEIEQLMISITQVFTDAIDTRIPYNFYHSRNVYLYVQLLVDYINEQHEKGLVEKHFEPSVRSELLMAALMHDIGKLVIPNEVIDKTTRLGNKLPLVLEHFDHLSALYHIDYLEGRISRDEWIGIKNELLDARIRVEDLNRKPKLSQEDVDYVRALAQRTYTNTNGTQISFLSLYEAECLEVPSGNLTKAERDIIRSHVKYTEKYLKKMNFGKRYPHLIQWAGAHHEMLDGSGYPRGLKGDEITYESRILTIVDVFEALTSADRPYKKAMEESKALSILTSMAEEGKLDPDILQLFKEALEQKKDKLQLFHQTDEKE